MRQNEHLETPPTRRRPWTYLLLGILIMLAVAGGIYYFQTSASAVDSKGKADKNKEKDAESPVPVALETAVKADFPVYLNGLGTVTALRTVTVKPRVDGELVKVLFTEGQWVKAGEVLAEIDPRPFQIQLQQAQGQLLRDEALLKNARIDQSRYQTLLEQDSIAAQQTATQTAQVKQYQGVVEMDKAQVNNAKLQLDYAHLTAPISGQVGLRLIDQGNIVHANDSNGIVVITQLQPISVVFTLPEDQVQAVMQRWRTKQSVAVTAFDRAGKTALATGTLLAIDNQIDPTTGTLKLKAQFDNTGRSLFANQFVNIKMHLDTLHDATLVPTAAIQNDSLGAFVYVVNAANTVELRRINLGPTEADNVVVLDNLAPGETVVLEGADRLRAGSLVDVTQKDGKAVAALPDKLAKPDGKAAKRGRRP